MNLEVIIMNCPNCGRPLEEGEVCNCVNEAPVTPQPPVEEPQAEPVAPQQQTYYAPVPPAAPQQNAYQQQAPFYGAPIAPPVARRDYPQGYKPKRKYAAVILAVTLGPFGIHNFYLGHKNKALTQLLIAVIGSLFFGLGFIASYVWAIVDAVELLTDKQDMDENGFKIQTFEEALVAERLRAEKEAKENE